jgi:predicted transcriptional regulator
MSDITELDKKYLEQRNREADEAWNRYQETGKAIPHDIVVKWLETWDTEKEAPCPTSQNL